MQAWAPVLSSVAIITERWASRCPACPELRCPAVSVALTCGGSASTGAIIDGIGFWSLICVAFFAAAVGALASYAIQQFERVPFVRHQSPGADPAFDLPHASAPVADTGHDSVIAVHEPLQPLPRLPVTPSTRRLIAAGNHGSA